MSTPAMLRISPANSRNAADPIGPQVAIPPRIDAVASLVVLLLGILCVGLFVAGALAVYDWTTPDSQGWVVETLSVLFGVAVIVVVGSASLRAARRGR